MPVVEMYPDLLGHGKIKMLGPHPGTIESESGLRDRYGFLMCRQR